MAQMNFNANQVEGDVKDFSPLPPGKYPAVIVKTELGRPNENGTEQLRVEWEVTDGAHKGRHISNWITVACKTQTAVDIGMRQLKNVCEAVGMAGFTDTDELCGRAHIIDVGTRKRTDGTTDSEVKKCHPAGAATAAPAAAQGAPAAAAQSKQAPAPAAAPAAASAAPATAGRPPWMK
jgi:hypothetical protein